MSYSVVIICLFTYSFCLFLQPEETRLISDTSGIFKPEVVAKKILQDTMVNLPTSYHMLVLSCPNFMKLLHNLRITESMVPFNFDDFHLCFCISMGGGMLGILKEKENLFMRFENSNIKLS
jgi:hypothetical protein